METTLKQDKEAVVSTGSQRGGSSEGGVYPIEGIVLLPRGSKLSSVRLMINGGKHVGIPQANGKFTIHGLAPGTYYLEVQCPEFVFSPIRIDISARDKGKVRATTADPMRKKERIRYPLSIKPIARPQYFEEHKPFNPLSFLANPMVLMMGVMMLIMFLSRFIDPEEMKRAQLEVQQQAKMRTNGAGPDTSSGRTMTGTELRS